MKVKQTSGKKRNTPWLLGKNNHQYKENIKHVCPICGKERMLKPHLAKTRKTCSPKCQAILLSKKMLGKKLTKKCKINISKGLKKSKEFQKIMKERNLNYFGNKNPNWRKKIKNKCSICNKGMMITPYEERLMKEKGFISCSKKCGSKITSRKLKGIKRPYAKKRMLENNPMWNLESIKKKTKTLKGRPDYYDIIKRMKKTLTGRKNINRIFSIEERHAISERMKINNPMKNKKTREKISKSIKKQYSSGLRRINMTKKNWQTKPENMLYEKIKNIFPKISRSKVVSNKNIPFFHPIDIAIYDKKIAIEVDGIYWHNYPLGTKRDKEINTELNKMGWKVLRFWEIEIYENIDEVVNKIRKCYDENN